MQGVSKQSLSWPTENNLCLRVAPDSRQRTSAVWNRPEVMGRLLRFPLIRANQVYSALKISPRGHGARHSSQVVTCKLIRVDQFGSMQVSGLTSVEPRARSNERFHVASPGRLYGVEYYNEQLLRKRR